MLDASAICEYLLDTGVGHQFGTVIEDPETQLNVPVLCDVELCSAIRQLILSGTADPIRAGEMLEDYVDLPIERHEHLPLVGRVLELRDSFTARDATYVALAERLGATLMTADGALTRAARRHLALNVIGVG